METLPLAQYETRANGVDIRLAVVDTGFAADALGDAVYRFRGPDADALAAVRFVEHSLMGSHSRTLGEIAAEHGFEREPGEPLALPVDAGIAAVAALLDRGEPFEYEIDGAEGSVDFWAFHDIGHAADDFVADWADGLAESPLEIGAWAEDRANAEGARRAHGAGVPLDDILAALFVLREPFAERFGGEQSTALDDFLETLPDGLGDAVRASVDSLADDVLEWANADDTLDEILDERLGEHGGADDIVEQHGAGAVLAALREWDPGEQYGGAEAGHFLDSPAHRAEQAVEQAVAQAVRDRAACPACGEERVAEGGATCSACAEDFDE
jgi:hypothetical protein